MNESIKTTETVIRNLLMMLCICLFAVACTGKEEAADVTEEPEKNIETEAVAEPEIEPEPESETETESEPKIEPENEGFDIGSLKAAADHDQLIICEAAGTEADYTMYEKNASGEWDIILETHGYVGREGIGEASEYKCVTPVGIYHFTDAFGRNPDPGCAMGYIQVDDTYFWVDDPESAHYNHFVTTKDTVMDWNSAENIWGAGYPYNYVLAFDYNKECIPGRGSAFFLHCWEGKPTSGCLSVSEDNMVKILMNIKPGCAIIIDSPENIAGY
ncbi:MAG: hypothetical protein K6A69_02300 [Lachnospiraceae bacterium]|nr:hypothetical protein [Lachnospiraceae bacterium]